MKYDAVTIHQYQTDDGTIAVKAELVQSKLRSLTLKVGGSGRVPADITPAELQELSELTANATQKLLELGVSGFHAPAQLATDASPSE